MERPIDLQRLAIIGAGPIGIEAALAGRELGYDVRVYERGTVGGNLRRWGHVRLFSSFELNHSGRGARLLQAEGFKLPEAGEYLTGEEHLERYLEPLSRTAPLSGCIHENTRVVSVGRDGIGKRDLIGGPRERYPFRLLVESEAGDEELVEADVLFDCSGTYGNHNWMGNGNVPALGERALEEHIAYELEDVTGTDRARYEAKRVLLVGDGHSASTALDGLRALPETTVHWVVRRQKPPAVIADDPLPERKRLSELAGELAAGDDARIHFYPKHTVELVRRESSAFEVELRSSRATKLVTVDRILAHVGYHPDRSLYRELPSPRVLRLAGSDEACRSSSRRKPGRLPGADVQRCRGSQKSGTEFLHSRGQELRQRLELPDPHRAPADRGSVRTAGRQEAEGASLVSASARVELRALDDLWFQISGTLCNLTCHHCFISCGPTNHTFRAPLP